MPLVPPASYAFSHLLTREATYGALLASNRKTLHGAAADVLSSRLEQGESPEEIALMAQIQRHLESAGRWREAHLRACDVLWLRVEAGLLADWDALSAHAELLWDQARGVEPDLPMVSSSFASAQARYFNWTGQNEEAQQTAKQAIEIARQERNLHDAAMALNILGAALCLSSHWDEAVPHFQEALAIFRELGDGLGELRILNNLGAALKATQRSDEGLRCNLEGLELAQRIEHLPSLAALELNLGRFDIETGDFEQAGQHLRWALEAYCRLGSLSGQSIALGCLGDMYAAAGEPDRAIEPYQEAIRLAIDSGSPYYASSWWAQLALAEEARGRDEAARSAVEEAIALGRHAGDDHRLCTSLIYAAKLAEKSGDAAQTVGHLQEAEKLLLHDASEEDAMLKQVRELLASNG